MRKKYSKDSSHQDRKQGTGENGQQRSLRGIVFTDGEHYFE